jgi:hypothetical protein
MIIAETKLDETFPNKNSESDYLFFPPPKSEYFFRKKLYPPPFKLNGRSLTNQPSHCQNTTNFNCGLSDVHNIVSIQIKGRIPKINGDYITYRSYNKFDHEKYVEDLEKNDYVNIGNESDINSAYEIFEFFYLEVVNKHISLKKRKPIQAPAPFMNKNLKNKGNNKITELRTIL